jgi:hypothetical protein
MGQATVTSIRAQTWSQTANASLGVAGGVSAKTMSQPMIAAPGSTEKKHGESALRDGAVAILAHEAGVALSRSPICGTTSGAGTAGQGTVFRIVP